MKKNDIINDNRKSVEKPAEKVDNVSFRNPGGHVSTGTCRRTSGLGTRDVNSRSRMSLWDHLHSGVLSPTEKGNDLKAKGR